MRFGWICRAAILRGLFGSAVVLTAAVDMQARDSIDAVIRSYSEKAPLNSSVWGICAVNMRGDTIVAVNASQRMVPASNVKLITTGVALDVLGEDYRFRTGIGYCGEIHGNTLVGDLYILGGADPTLGVRENIANRFGEWKSFLDKAGISTISGRVIADSRYLRDGEFEKSWQYEDIECGDASIPRGLNFRKNVRNFTQFRDSDFIAIPLPADTCAVAFSTFLEEGGIHITGGCADSSSPDIADRREIRLLGESSSVPLSEIIRETNYESDNFYAETLYRMLSERYVPVRDALNRMGLETKGRIQLLDGCGLSRKDYVSPEFFVSFLSKMYRTEVFGAYLKSLPQPGAGTLGRRLYKSSDKGKKRVYMKSGSMNGILCYSGYILPESNDPSDMIAFSLLTNNVVDSGGNLNRIIDEIILNLLNL